MDKLDSENKQCEKDIQTLQKNLDELKKQRVDNTWIVKYSPTGSPRVCINIETINARARDRIAQALRDGKGWFSLCSDGCVGDFYNNTKSVDNVYADRATTKLL